MEFQIRLAETVIAIRTIFGDTLRLCRDYLCEGCEPDIWVEISAEDIQSERERSGKNNVAEGLEPAAYSDGYLETLAVYRKIAAAMPAFDTFLMHGSVIASNQGAVMFTAKSGVGKTTRTMLWLKNDPGSFVVNGDKPLIRVTETEVLAAGTPWAGKENLHRNTLVPLRAVFILERADENRITELSLIEALPFLATQIYKPEDVSGSIQTMRLISKTAGKVRYFKLSSNLESEAIELAHNAVFAD